MCRRGRTRSARADWARGLPGSRPPAAPRLPTAGGSCSHAVRPGPVSLLHGSSVPVLSPGVSHQHPCAVGEATAAQRGGGMCSRPHRARPMFQPGFSGSESHAPSSCLVLHLRARGDASCPTSQGVKIPPVTCISQMYEFGVLVSLKFRKVISRVSNRAPMQT